jgi:hypothetical protein
MDTDTHGWGKIRKAGRKAGTDFDRITKIKRIVQKNLTG